MTTDFKSLLGTNNGLSKKDMINMNFVDVPTEKQKISITRHRQFNGGTTPAKNNESIVIESGECNLKFRLKIISLERIHKIFDEIRKQVSTDNLETIPRNVTLHHSNVIDKWQKEKTKKADKKK